MLNLPRPSRILVIALMSALSGCKELPDYGFAIVGGGTYAVGSIADLHATNHCPSPRELPCDEQREVFIDSITLDDPTVFSLDPSVSTPTRKISLRVLRAGSTEAHITARRPGGAMEIFHRTLVAQNAATLTVMPTCSLGATAEVLLLPPRTEAAIKVHLVGGMDELLSGRGFLPIDFGALTLVEKEEHTLGALFRVRTPDSPISTAITTPLDPAFSRRVEVYTLSQVDGLSLVPTAVLRARGYIALYAMSSVAGTQVCRDVSERPGHVLVTVETPATCSLSADGSQAQATLATKFFVYGLAAGTCRISAQFEGMDASGSREFEVQPP